MMKTPICDFAAQYAKADPLRLHMPGHKGVCFTGAEKTDITEIPGADSLYEAEGIIRQSEQNAGALFGAKTFYSTEGSSLCIRAMVHLLCLYAKEQRKTPLIAAVRNVHKSFLSAVALTDASVQWLYPENRQSYLSCLLTPETLDRYLQQAAQKPIAVYVTSPDYPGHIAQIRELSAVCHNHGVLLAVDNAHGAYLHFLPQSLHPIFLGADLCCDSAHKTLPVLTGGAYLHIHPDAPALFSQQAKEALSLFGSTSPSYLILQSLDRANAYLSADYREKLAATVAQLDRLKAVLTESGYTVIGNEPLKLTIDAKSYGYFGWQMAQLLAGQNITVEFFDPDMVVMMFTPEITEESLARLEKEMRTIPKKPAISHLLPALTPCPGAMTVREAIFSARETVDIENSVGRILAAPSVSCPPAVPIVVCGERITEEAVALFRYYGIQKCQVIPE